MFCDNVSYNTDRQQNISNYCHPKNGYQPAQSFNYVPTEQSQRNPSNLYNNIISGRPSHQNQLNAYLQNAKGIDTVQLMNENTQREEKRMQAVQRNKNLSAILSIVLAFSQRIQALKEKLCGYPAENFSPAQFFNVLDLTEKGYVDIYDVKRFVNNEKIRQKDIISLYKRVNGDHSKDNSRLSYFGYLNLIKPYFNEQLARDLLLRDTVSKKGTHNKKKGSMFGQKIDNEMIEPTQQSVLLLFQQLILLHCICASQHQNAKQLLMNEYMLNTLEIKQILGLNDLDSDSISPKVTLPSKDTNSRVKHKTTLSVMYEFIQNNSQFQIDFSQMRYVLSYLNCHEFSLINDKYLSVLFMPTNCKSEILKEIQKKKDQIAEYEDTQNYMATYLTKENLMNRGNIQGIRNYLDEKANYTLSGQQARVMASTLGAPFKTNFLQFVHPRSLQRMNQNQQDPNLMYPVNQQPLLSPHPSKQHPEFQINASNKRLSQNQSGGFNQSRIPASERQYSNNSSIPQQNIKIIPPKDIVQRQDYDIGSSQRYQNSIKQDYHQNVSSQSYAAKSGLQNEFYEGNEKQRGSIVNTSQVSNTPFLQQFMNKSNILRNYQKESRNPQQYKRKIINEESSQVQSSGYSDSAFQVIDYGYESSKINNKTSKNQQAPIYADQSQKAKKQTLDSRYNMVISQYKNPQQNAVNLPKSNKNQQQNSSYSRNLGYANDSYGPKFERSMKRPEFDVKNPNLDYSNGNYVENVGLSQSNMVNQSNLLNKFSTGGGNILNQFFKK